MISVPSALISYKMSKKQYKIFNSRIEDLRKITEIKNILVNYENVKELKIYRLGKFFEEYATKLCDKFICQNKIVKKRVNYSCQAISNSPRLFLYIHQMLTVFIFFLILLICTSRVFVSPIYGSSQAYSNMSSLANTCLGCA